MDAPLRRQRVSPAGFVAIAGGLSGELDSSCWRN